jgi:SAM-dependent methyltransferase
MRPRTASNPPPGVVQGGGVVPVAPSKDLPPMRPATASQVAAREARQTPVPPKIEAEAKAPPMRARAISSPGMEGLKVAPPVAAPSRPQVSPQLLASVPAPVPLEITQPLDAPKKKPRGWWEELFNEDYLRASPDADNRPIKKEVDFIEDSLGVAQGATILDLGCGTGRHAIELARRGYKVVGLDASPVMLGRAQDAARRANVDVTFVQGDMREMPFEDAFDGVFSWDMSFGYFEEDKNAMVVALVRKALRKGGQFLLDVQNRDYIVHQTPSVAWFEGDRCICMDEMQVDFITSRMRVKRTMIMDDGRSREIEYSIRVYSLHELGRVLHEQGFRVAEVSGRLATPGVYFGNESPRTLILAEKR